MAIDSNDPSRRVCSDLLDSVQLFKVKARFGSMLDVLTQAPAPELAIGRSRRPSRARSDRDFRLPVGIGPRERFLISDSVGVGMRLLSCRSDRSTLKKGAT